MKKILLSFLLVMFAICGTFAKEKKTETKENLVEITSREFFSGNYSIQKDIVYKITNLEIYVFDKLCIYSNHNTLPVSLANSLAKILTKDEKERIKRAGEYVKFNSSYIVYAQTKKHTGINDLKFIKVENIPTFADIDTEEKRIREERERLEAERIAKEQAEEAARIAEEQERQAKFEKQKKELSDLFIKSGREGFDNLPWGTSVDFFLWLNPSATPTESEGSLVNYEVDIGDNIKVYKFHEGELVGGVITYTNVNETLADDINHRLAELYGKPSDKKDLGGHKTENVLGYYISYYDLHFRVIWNKSSTFKVQLDVTGKQLDSGYDIMDRMLLNQSPKIAITYSNEKKMAAIKASDEKKKKAAEAEAQRQRIDNLGL